MKVKKPILVKALVALGFPDAPNWPDAKLLAKGNKFGKMVDEAALAKIPAQGRPLVKSWVTKLQAGESMELEGGAAAPAKAGKGEKKAAKEKKEKGPGVIDTIIECLKAASKTNPVTKAEILAKLVKRFPDRREEAMKTTLNIQCPTRLRDGSHALPIDKNEKGFFLTKG